MKATYFVASIVMIIFLFASCARKMNCAPSTVVPAASGKVKIKKDKNNNYSITVNVLNLAEAKKLSPPRNVYVVWLDGEGSGTRNIGQISTSSSIFSKALRGELNATSPAKPRLVFITAEDDGNAQYPGYQTVLSTR